jgi:hypothetical protein
MSWFGKLFRMRLRLLSRQVLLWVFLALAGLFALLPLYQVHNQAPERIPIALVAEEKGPLIDLYVQKLRQLPNMYVEELEDLAKAQRNLYAGKYEAVLVVKDNFSQTIENAKSEEVFTLYLTPSASIAGALSEIFAEQYLEIWIENFLIKDYLNFFEARGEPVSPAELNALQEEMKEHASTNRLLEILIHESDAPTSEAPEDPKHTAFNQSIAYFCALVPFFIVLSGRWVIDQRHNSLGERMKALGISQVLSVSASSLAMLLLCFVVLLVPALITAIGLNIQATLVFSALGAALLYLLAMIGVALILAAIATESVHLMLFTPLVVLLNTFLGGLGMSLPQWGSNWNWLSFILPGRLLSQSLSTQNLLPLLLAAIVYFGLGLLLVNVFQERHASKSD